MQLQDYRLICAVSGFVLWLGWEWLAPHHAPTTSRWARWRNNLALTVFNSVLVSLVCFFCLWTQQQFGLFRLFDRLGAPLWLRYGLEIGLLDLAIYWQHRTFHRWAGGWRFHRVHHSDRDLDVTSASRFHAGEILLSAVYKGAVVLLLGVSLTGLILFEIILLFAAQFQHANIRLSPLAERWVSNIFITPALHRQHHCPQLRHQDTNFGTLLTLWDRLFGTYHLSRTHEPTFGLLELNQARDLQFHRLLSLPFDGASR